MKAILVHSVYHLFYALSIAEKQDFKNIRIVCSTSDPTKFESIFQIIHEKFSIQVIALTHDDKASMLCAEDLKKIHDIKKLPIKEFIIFNQDNFLSVYLTKTFKSKGVRISLSQDALKAYVVINKIAPKYKIERTLQFFKFLYCNKFEFMLFFVNLDYGNFKFIDSLYLSHPRVFSTNDKTKFKQNLSPSILDHFSILIKGSNISFSDETIFYASSLLKYNKKQVTVEIAILDKLAQRFKNFQLILKVHPRVKPEVLSELKKQSKWIIVDEPYPAEIILNMFVKVVYVFSAYSGISLFEPKDLNLVKFFWLYPIYGDSLSTLSYTKIIHPSDSIKLLSNIEEIQHI